MTDENQFEIWGILEIMGHQTYAGHISEQTIAGDGFIRVDVPQVGELPAFTKIFGAASIYAITPTTEEVARMRAESLRQSPLSVYDLPAPVRQMMGRAALPAAEQADDRDDIEEMELDRESY